MAKKNNRNKAQQLKHKRTRERVKRRRNVERELAGADYDYLGEAPREKNSDTKTDDDGKVEGSPSKGSTAQVPIRITALDVIKSWLPEQHYRGGVKYKKRYKFTQQAKKILMISGTVCLGILVGGGFLINWLNENYSDMSGTTSTATETITAKYADTGLSRTQVKTIEATGKFDRFLLIDGVTALSVYDDVITTNDATVLRSREQLDETGIIYNGLGYNETSDDEDDTDSDDTTSTSTSSSSNFTWSGQFNNLFLNAGSSDDEEDNIEESSGETTSNTESDN